jgi:hypothetical protein
MKVTLIYIQSVVWNYEGVNNLDEIHTTDIAEVVDMDPFF